MTWALPWAWALTLAVVLPLVAHLWSRRRPTPRPFSTLRFLRAASPVSRRLQRVKDWPLLSLRAAIVTAIAAAAAGPTLATARRVDAWRARVHRVIVVDAAVAASAADTVAEWQRTAVSSEVLPAAMPMQVLPEAIARATAAARESRAEVAIAWTGRAVAVPPRVLAGIPAHVGLRLAAIPHAWSNTASGSVAIEVASEDAALAARLREIATPAPARSGLAVRVILPGGPARAATTERAAAEALALLDALATDPRIRQAAERSSVDPRSSGGAREGRPLAFDAAGRPMLAGWADGATVELSLAATPGSPLALRTLQVVREAIERPELGSTPATWTAEDLARASRDGQPPATAQLPAGLDTRWAWGLALVLLGMEQWWRRRPAASADAVGGRDAA